MTTRTLIIGCNQADAQRYRELVAEHGSPLLVFDPKVLHDQYQRLEQALPGVDLYYAVKALPEACVIKEINILGGGFDIASRGEMELLLEQRISGNRTIHTHPIKKDQEIRAGLRFGATTFVIDNLSELEKLLPYRKRIGVLLRISFRSEDAKVDLSRKFGCDISEAPSIIQAAADKGIHIRGCSFHVGSQCQTASKHVEAIEQCAELMHTINLTAHTPMATLDIGGGFPADYALTGLDIQEFCAPIRSALDQLPSDWHLLAEPGRYLVAPSVFSITTISGKAKKGDTFWYYLDDGVYGSYSGQMFDHAVYPLQTLSDGPLHPTILTGPTCDSIDVVAEGIELPELSIGDLIIGHQMGAYTAATKTRFNSLADAKLICLPASSTN